jgi:hypothetical protein
MFSSAAVDVIVVPPNVKAPEISTAPFISIVVAAICISVSATKSN